jgi:MFS family permease
VLLVGASLTAAGLALFAASLATLWLAVAGIAIAGVGFGALLGAPTRYIITNEVPAATRATGVGLLSIFLIIGQIFGGSLAGGVVGAHIDDVAGYRLAYEIFAAVAVLAALGTFALASQEKERKAPLI